MTLFSSSTQRNHGCDSAFVRSSAPTGNIQEESAGDAAGAEVETLKPDRKRLQGDDGEVSERIRFFGF